MGTGLDTREDCSPNIACLQEKGLTFVGRYYNSPVSYKTLKLAEAQALSQSGLFIVAVWETAPTSAAFFSHSQGVHDGAIAYHYANSVIGQPPDTPIYFAVDYDASSRDIRGVINDYFEGVAEAFRMASGTDPDYAIGIYGSGCACSWLLQNNADVTYAWLAQSTGWCGSSDFTAWNIKQGPAGAICGMSADSNETNGNGGGFQIG